MIPIFSRWTPLALVLFGTTLTVCRQAATEPTGLEGREAEIREKEHRLLYDTARQLYQEKKFYGAKTVFLQVQQSDANYRLVRQYLSAIERKLERKEGVAPAGADEAKSVKALYDEGVSLFRKKEFEAARERFLAAAEIDPGYSGVEKNLERVEEALSAGAKAEGVEATEAARPDPQAQELTEEQQKERDQMLDGAYLLEKSGKFGQAISMVEKALQIDPENRRGRRQLARLQASLAKSAEKPQPAKAAESKEKKSAPKISISTLEKEADRLYRDGALAEARALYEEILKHDPANPVAAAMLKVIDRRLTGGGAGVATGGIGSKARRVLLEKARAAFRIGDSDYARDLLAALLLENPDDKEARELLNRVDLTMAKAREKAEAKKRKNSEAEQAAEEVQRLRALRRLVQEEKFEEVAKEADLLLERRPAWDEVLVIRELALHAIEEGKEKRLAMEGDIADHRELVKVGEAGLSPEEPAPIPRPEIRVTSPPIALSSVQEKLEQKVSVNLVEADLSYVLDLLFRATGVNIVANPEMIGQKQITVHVEQIPLKDLLEYISRNYGILFSVSRSAIWVSTPDQPFLETQIRHLDKGLTDVSESVESTSSDVEKLMERIADLIDWPQGSQYYLDKKKNILFMRSTPEALAKANELINAVDVAPLQILIETRFIELETDNFNDLDIDFSLTSDFGIIKKGGGNKIQIDAGSGTELGGGVGDLRPSDDPSPNADPNSEGMDLTVSGVLTDPQFQLVIKALQDSQKAKTLSAPRILAMNNYTSQIEITQSLIYIENYEVDRADISGTTVGAVPGQAVPGQAELSSEPIIIPQFAEDEEIGFSLKVTPSVGLDHRQISLVLEPEITEQVDEITFNLIIPDFEGDAPITRPIISKRNLTTKVTVEDGSVLVIAGLIRHRKGKRLTKIPVLGDIPYLRVLFRREGDFEVKTNLLIFVKATLLDGRGRRYFDAGLEGTASRAGGGLGQGATIIEGPRPIEIPSTEEE